MNRAKIQDYIDQRVEERKGSFHSRLIDDTHLEISKHVYEIVMDKDNSFNLDSFTDRFSMILSKFNYIVGDWGYGQLRLRGFYDRDNPLFKPDQGVDTIQDYLYEECNFGCHYFILHNLEVNVPKQNRRHRNRRRRPEIQEKRRKLVEPSLKHRRHQEVKRVRNNKKPHFVIKKRENQS